uniref:Putative secreted protein n=1 Tax=Anopheles marajoara TaxID=58244 RepID=A0A2M4CF32_9DIPT
MIKRSTDQPLLLLLLPVPSLLPIFMCEQFVPHLLTRSKPLDLLSGCCRCSGDPTTRHTIGTHNKQAEGGLV